MQDSEIGQNNLIYSTKNSSDRTQNTKFQTAQRLGSESWTSKQILWKICQKLALTTSEPPSNLLSSAKMQRTLAVLILIILFVFSQNPLVA